MAMLFVAFACLGLVIPSTMVLALEEHGPIAGMASALGGTLQMVAGAAMIGVVSVFFDGTSLPMVTVIALCAVGAFIAQPADARGARQCASSRRNRAAAPPVSAAGGFNPPAAA